MEKPMIVWLLLSLFSPLLLLAPHIQPIEAERGPKPYSHITVIGTVYCDICSNNSFSTHSYFLPGVEVKIDCKFKASAPKTAEEITFSVNRTTNRFGWYKLEIPSVDGIQCASDSAVVSLCRATLAGTSSSSSSSSSNCNVPGYKSTTDVVETNVCIYGLSALSFRTPKRSRALCGN
ncbi:hypothetical protein Cgig2_012977 [Carnegiea gigantea]|uniref:Uncharacterized protein n=1 Tax=Carnegiea gigantea TaxID=171969 RepID=A0A9Q1GQ54_9CARY|nr:hypothetical protein Cgig2_012977 [Carnegiea gigantea]